jgi:hypothetical protein
LLKKTRKTIAAIATSSVRSLMGRLVAEVDKRIGAAWLILNFLTKRYETPLRINYNGVRWPSRLLTQERDPSKVLRVLCTSERSSNQKLLDRRKRKSLKKRPNRNERTHHERRC